MILLKDIVTQSVVTFVLLPWPSFCITDLSSSPCLPLRFSFPQGCSLALSCATASTFLGTWARARWAVPSTRAPPRCWSTSAADFTSTPWKERSAPTRWTTCRTMRCCERCGGDLKGDGLVTVYCCSNWPKAASDAAVWFKAALTFAVEMVESFKLLHCLLLKNYNVTSLPLSLRASFPQNETIQHLSTPIFSSSITPVSLY